MKFRYKDWNVTTQFERYAVNGAIRLDLIADEDDPGDPDTLPGEPISTVTVAVSSAPPPGPNEVLIKTWSENEDTLPLLVAAGLVRDTGRRIACGGYGAEAAVCELLIPTGLDS
jgi:hypothetical protein